MTDMIGSAIGAIGNALGLGDITAGMHAMSYRFNVQVGTFPLGTWNKCDGLKMDFQYAQYVAGMNPDERSHIAAPIWNYPTRIKYDNITLSRPITTTGIAQTATWLKQMDHLPAPSMGQIMMFDAGGLIPVWAWQLMDVQPATWSGPSMDVDAGKIATETLTLVHQGWLF